MKRRSFLQLSSLAGAGSLLPVKLLHAQGSAASLPGNDTDDRAYWVALLDKIATPVLEHLSRGELRKNMPVKYSDIWDGRDKQVAYLEAFGRLLAGIAPWFTLPPDNTREGMLRKRIYEYTLNCIAHSVNPESPDYMLWYDRKTAQPLVDAAYFAHGLIRAPEALWKPLSDITKRQVITEFKKMRQRKPFNNNWVLFGTIMESFLLMVGEEADGARIDYGIDKMNEWYVGDGWYGDGPKFAFDHYNGYDMHCMLVDSLRINVEKGRRKKEEFELAYRRMQRYAHFQERLISPEGYYPVIGRSSTYRTGTFQPLAQLALEDRLPEQVKPAQVRSALTAVMKHVFIPSTFTGDGWLRLGLVGDRQESIADYYSNTGSMYIASLVFLPLGLPPSHAFWADPFTEWTQLRAWKGEPFSRDYVVDY